MIDVVIVHGDGLLLTRLQDWAEVNARDLRLSEASVGDLIQEHTARPDVVLVDVVPADTTELAADVGRLLRAGFWPLAVARDADPELGVTLLAAGVCVLVGKDQDPAAIAAAVRASATGNTTCSGTGVAAAPCHRRPRLSEREESVLRAYASGLTLPAVARRIGIQPATAKTYLDRVKAKYREIGKPAHTKLELALRLREDFPGG
jgi:two-component system, NarL family, nitrate/nitrite response regulator NarL